MVITCASGTGCTDPNESALIRSALSLWRSARGASFDVQSIETCAPFQTVIGQGIEESGVLVIVPESAHSESQVRQTDARWIVGIAKTQTEPSGISLTRGTSTDSSRRGLGSTSTSGSTVRSWRSFWDALSLIPRTSITSTEIGQTIGSRTWSCGLITSPLDRGSSTRSIGREKYSRCTRAR